MVRYTGRQKTITGAVNRNQVGLKMSGCPSRVGRSGKNIRFLGRRVNCMYGLCGPTMVNGAPWRTTGRNDPPYCRQRSTACAQAAGGVGHINSPYTRTRVPAAGKQGCTQVNVGANTPWWYNNPAVLAAAQRLHQYIQTLTTEQAELAFIGDHETVKSDHLETALGYDPTDDAWLLKLFDVNTAPAQIKADAELLNSMALKAYVNGKKMVHEVGMVGIVAKYSLPNHGLQLKLAPNFVMGVYGDKCSQDSDESCRGTIGAEWAPLFGLCDGPGLCNSGTGFCAWSTQPTWFTHSGNVCVENT